MYLVISEKPSVSQSIAKVLGAYKREDGYLQGKDCIVSWCLGHLTEYAAPDVYDEKYHKWNYEDLPIIPKEWKLFVSETKQDQFEVLKTLLNRSDFDYVVNACDAGREGELIFRRVYELSGSNIPVKRLWISSMEDRAIINGFENLRDGKEYDHLFESAVCRAKADWLIGMNATRAFTSKYYKRLIVGRVQTPTLAMLVDRQKQICDFEKKSYYKVVLQADDFLIESDAYEDEEEALALKKTCEDDEIEVRKVERIQKTSAPPKLYDLTTLQREANRIFGYTAQETLKELQELYEDKLITYPRTDSQYITEDMEGTLRDLVTGLSGAFFFLENHVSENRVERTVNNEKVTDHHAILPTKEAMKADLSGLSVKKKNLFCLLGQRVAQAVAGDCIYDEIVVEAWCGNHVFQAKGSTIVEAGYKKIEDTFSNLFKKKKAEKQKNGVSIPINIAEGDRFHHADTKVEKRFTSPPKPFSDVIFCERKEWIGIEERSSA